MFEKKSIDKLFKSYIEIRLLNSAESPMSIPIIPSSSPFRFHNIKKKIPKSFRFNPTDGPKLISTNENKFATMTPNNQLTPDVG